MFNIKSIVYKFSDVVIYCVGLQSNIDMLSQFFIMHQNNIESKKIAERIVFHSVYCRFSANNILSLPQYNKCNRYLKNNGFLMDLKYFDEAMFISNPQKIIKMLEAQNLYGKSFKVSQYWKNKFPHLPDEFPIRPNYQ